MTCLRKRFFAGRKFECILILGWNLILRNFPWGFPHFRRGWRQPSVLLTDKQKNHLLPHEQSRRFATFIMSWLLVVEHFYRFIIDFYVAVITMKTDLLIFIYLIYLVLTTDCTTVGRFQRSYQL